MEHLRRHAVEHLARLPVLEEYHRRHRADLVPARGAWAEVDVELHARQVLAMRVPEIDAELVDLGRKVPAGWAVRLREEHQGAAAVFEFLPQALEELLIGHLANALPELVLRTLSLHLHETHVCGRGRLHGTSALRARAGDRSRQRGG